MSLYISLFLTIVLIVGVMWCFYRYVDRTARKEETSNIVRYLQGQHYQADIDVQRSKGNSFSDIMRRSVFEGQREAYKKAVIAAQLRHDKV